MLFCYGFFGASLVAQKNQAKTNFRHRWAAAAIRASVCEIQKPLRESTGGSVSFQRFVLALRFIEMRYSTKLIEHIKFESVCNGIIVPRITNPAERGIWSW